MNWKIYRLYFGGEYVMGSNFFGHLCYQKERPTRMFFKARNIEEADRKAKRFMRKAELRGIYYLQEEQGGQE